MGKASSGSSFILERRETQNVRTEIESGNFSFAGISRGRHEVHQDLLRH